MSTSEERERIAEERRLAHVARIAMVKQLSSEGKSNAEIAQLLGINQNTVRDARKESDEINWGYNCLTAGVHHGRPEAIWNLPLLQAVHMFTAEELEDLVVYRIYTDALIYVHRGDESRMTEEWAKQVKEYAEALYPNVLRTKVGEITKYYDSPEWHRDVHSVVDRVKNNRLNPSYQPLHGHDTINMLCRIIGVSCARKAS